MYRRFNKNDDAIEVLKRGLKTFTNNTELAELLARCLSKKACYKEAISYLLKAGKNIRHAKAPQKIYYELGKNYHKDAQYGKAFAAFTTANKIMRNSDQAEQYDAQNFLHELETLKVNVMPTYSNIWRYGAPTAEQSPVFLLGFPCSGSELLEKVLHIHPALWTLNNKPSLSAVTQQLKTRYGSLDKALPQVTNEQIGRLRTLYLQTVEQFNDQNLNLRPVDNQPLNSALSGVLYPLFPKAKFIFMLRHPLDACLSAYMRNFAITEKTICFTDLVTTAQTYARAMDVWAHNVEQFPIDYHILRYEDLIDDPKTQTAELCDYLQLPWYEELLPPIEQNFKFDWKNYRAAIEPIRDILMPYISQFGYDAD
jgi:tetratricopeptide (TPR) repeat protein